MSSPQEGIKSAVFVIQSYLTLCVTPWSVTLQNSCPWDSPGKNTGVCCHSLLQSIFPTQRSNPSLLHCRQILYHLSCRGSPEGGISALLRREQRACSMLTHLPPPPTREGQ
ncbi:unnamed protein product [Rangifer tarandus platyrhynchus]|uniref:Uncharacterized protein n=2 Tax=Rangifer tarandus platyrhynchus TaxID=3082113 RepID=A0AC59ZA41_RANTA|nr:unnamed protein product [Rangifer tarandus platyrhynchus]